MLLIFLSTMESCVLSALIVSSPCILGPAVTVPSMRPPTAPPAGLPAVPTVVEFMGAPLALEVEPAELAVPAELVPGALDVVLGALPTPLGSLPELLSPPTLAGPVTPLTAAVPAPAEPALGGPAPAPEAPPADAPPADPPPADPPPPPPPPPLCAKVDIGQRRTATRSSLHGNEMGIGKLLSSPTPWQTPRSRKPERIRHDGLKFMFCSAEFVMRKSNWTPSIVPNGDDKNVYIVLDDFGRSGRANRETDAERVDLEAVIMDMLEGQYHNPVRVICFNTAEKWSQDVSGDVAHELRRRCDLQLRDVPFYLEEFVERHEGRRPLPRYPASASDAHVLSHGLPAQEARGDRRQSTLPRLYRASTGKLDRESAEWRTLDPRNQDGYRVQVHLANTEVKVYTRRGYDWTHRFKKIASDAWHIGAGSAIIDGEVVASAADGTTDFSVLQNELKGRSTKIVMVAFDLLYLNGYDCGSCHWSSERRSSRRASTKRTSSLARASRSTAPKCSSMHARPG
jgi:hypothetical protein